MYKLFPFLVWMKKVTWGTMRDDALAGFTNAAVVLPQGVAFASIAGLPPEYGLYTAMITPIVAALFGSSAIMVSGPTTAISVVVLSALSGNYAVGSAEFIQAAILLTFLVGIIQLIFGLARLGVLAAFVSNSVMVGFTAAAAILIGVSQLKGALGVDAERGGSVVDRLLKTFFVVDEFNWRALVIASITFALTVLFVRYAKKWPGFLLAIVGGAIVGYLLNGQDNGVKMVGELPSITPSFVMPYQSIDQTISLIESAFAIAIIGLLEAVSIGRAFALKTGVRFKANQEIVGQGLSNFIGSFFQAYPGSGSFTRSGVNYASGAKTALSAVFSSVFLFLMLLVISPLISHIPIAAISGLIIYVAIKLIHVDEIMHIVKASGGETAILVLTFLIGVFVELELSIFLGVIISLVFFLSRTMHPKFYVGAPDASLEQRTFRNAETFNLPECPQMLICRFDGPLYFGSAEFLELEFLRIANERPLQKHIVVNLKGTGDIDLAGVDTIAREALRRRKHGGDLYVIARAPKFIARLRKLGLFETIGEDHLYDGKTDAISKLVPKLDKEICKTCKYRVFQECKNWNFKEKA